MDVQALALAAGQSAAASAAEMIRFAREGQHSHTAFEEDTVEQLADALKLALEVEREIGPADEERGQLHAALRKYLDGWA